MERLMVFSLIGIVLIAVLFAIVTWTPRKIWIKYISGILVISLFGVGVGTFLDLLSRPKPTQYEWFEDLSGSEVLHGVLIEGRGIYLWLRIPEDIEPRYYVLPWNSEVAKKFLESMRKARGKGTPLMFRYKKTGRDEQEPMFWATPQEPLPPKPERAPAQEFRHPSISP